MGRLELLNEIGHAMRLQGAATYNRIGLLPNTSTLAWAAPSGARYSATLHGTSPVADVQIQGPVRAVEQTMVLEIAFDAVFPSSRHKSGLAMRFPRVHRIRWDKPADEADTLETVQKLVVEAAASEPPAQAELLR